MALGWLKNAFSPAAQEPWEKDREDFFKAIKKNKVAQIREIAVRYPNEALGWKTENGSPLYVAHENKRFEAFKVLVELGADINEKYTFGKGKGRTPLMRAIDRNETEWLEFIAGNGGDLAQTRAEFTLSPGIGMWTVYTPLGFAIEKGDEKAVKILLAKGVDPAAPCYNVAFDKAPQPDILPVAYAEQEKQYKIVDYLKRAVLRASTPAAATAAQPVPAPIGVMQPLKLKKGAAAPAGTP